MVEKSPPSARIRSELLDLVRDLAISEGWTDATLMQAGRELGLTPGEVKLAAPEGINTLLETWGHEADAQARAVMEQADLSEMKIREKVTFGVRARIEALSPYKETARKAAHALAAPWRATLGAKIIWDAADTIWDALGDTSTDSNWYTKRMTLSVVITSVLNVWLAEDDEDLAWEKLDERIENVMQFEKFKFQARKFGDKLPDPLDLLKVLPKSPF